MMEPVAEAALTEHLKRLELELMEPEFRRDRNAVSAVLAEDFYEHGSSGRVWSRDAILDLLATEEPQPAPHVEAFAMRLLAPGIALVTYRTVRPQQVTQRCSIWRETASGWQVLFHQGTKIGNAKA